MPPRPDRLSQLLLGERHATFGEYDVEVFASGRTAMAISVGGAYVELWKGELTVPNEDCAFACEDGDRTLLFVADGHTGHHASHALANRMRTLMVDRAVPDSPELLAQLVDEVVLTAADAADPSGDPDAHDSATTMLTAVVDRAQGRLFGLCNGDSSAVVLPHGERAVSCAEKADDYVIPWRPKVFAAWPPRAFEHAVAPGDLVIVHSDGIDECHRGKPETSVRLSHLDLLRADGGDAEQFLTEVVKLALRGADGHPGGEDNIAAIVTTC